MSSLPPGFDGKLLSGKHVVMLKTSQGDITLELDASAAPRTVTNFVVLARMGYFNGLTFHRVIQNFMIQGGDPNGDGTGGKSIYGETFEDEINAASYGLDRTTIGDLTGGTALDGCDATLTIQACYEQSGYHFRSDLRSLPMERGAIVMANAGPNTNGSQFFIIQAEETPWLEGRHTVFGRVTEGLNIIDAIATVPRGPRDKPLEPVTFTVEVIE